MRPRTAQVGSLQGQNSDAAVKKTEFRVATFGFITCAQLISRCWTEPYNENVEGKNDRDDSTYEKKLSILTVKGYAQRILGQLQRIYVYRGQRSPDKNLMVWYSTVTK